MTFLAALRHDRITALASSMVPSTARASRPTWSSSWCPRGSQATSWWWTTSARTRVAASAAWSARPAQLLFLPPYSPDPNPIEQVSPKLKTLLRKAEESTINGVCTQIGRLLECFRPAECASYLRNAGYASI